MKHYDILIIGGDAAGMSAASQARRTSETLSIGVFEKGPHVSYAACGMPYYIAGDVPAPEDLVAIDVRKYIEKRKIEIYMNTEVTSVDLQAKTAAIQSTRGDAAVSFDKLVIATGARPVAPPIPGIDAGGVFYLRSLSDAIAIKKYIEEKKPISGLIIGGGFIGLEMSETLRRLNIETTILEKFESVAMTMSPDVRETIRDTLLRNGVKVRTALSIDRVTRRGETLTVHTDAGDFDADFIIVSVGITPNTGFLAGSGIKMTDRGAIIVDEFSRTSMQNVYAAGDCATVRSIITGKDVYMPLGTTANKQGRVAGIHAAGAATDWLPGIVGSQLVKVFDLEVGKIGLNYSDAAREGIKAVSHATRWMSRAGYYPGSRDILVVLTMDTGTGEVIGGEVAGTDGAALRANVIAAAVTAKMKVRDLAYIDLGYAPPFAPVWDAVNAAAQALAKLAR
ncbi:MAG TPA: FAD-dependent oxidoreductase [Spirochaetota bacterium]|nr:FAD-dependent oxidoreductase [Spirochaetota bacterium]HOD16671.1 FAD-dependent oxidoreductase [Spirochaetota bacterium]HPG51073.1 FAD-dependent oxidoreductase [Spirochaetota bacterium]HPN13574.1 FAD-dependent oxidoreductase [Spirochaetota bacterium]